MPSAAPSTAARSPVPLLMAASTTSSFDRFVTAPLLLTLAADFGVRLSTAAAAASWYYLLYGASQPLWGLCSDRLGRVRTMRLALLVAAVAGSCAVLASTLAWVVVARAVAGAAMGAVVPTCLVYVGDAVPFARRQHTLTDLNAATAAGITLSTALGGLLAATVSWRAGFAPQVLAALLLVVLLRRLPEPERPAADRGRLGVVLRNRGGRLVLGLSLVEGAALLGFLTFLAPALESTGHSPTTAGLVVALYGVGLLLASRVVKRRIASTAPAVLIGVGAGLLVVAYAVMTASRAPVAVGLAALLVGAGWAAMHSTMQAWATEAVPGARAVMVSLFAGMLFLGSGLATAALAPLADDHRWSWMFGIAVVLVAGFGVVAAAARARFRPGG